MCCSSREQSGSRRPLSDSRNRPVRGVPASNLLKSLGGLYRQEGFGTGPQAWKPSALFENWAHDVFLLYRLFSNDPRTVASRHLSCIYWECSEQPLDFVLEIKVAEILRGCRQHICTDPFSCPDTTVVLWLVRQQRQRGAGFPLLLPLSCHSSQSNYEAVLREAELTVQPHHPFFWSWSFVFTGTIFTFAKSEMYFKVLFKQCWVLYTQHNGQR